MDKLTFPVDWPDEDGKRLDEDRSQEETFGPDLLHKHRIDTPGILTQTVELTTTAQQGEQ